MSLALSRQSRTYLPDRQGESADHLLRQGLAQATQTKRALREALQRVSPHPRVSSSPSASVSRPAMPPAVPGVAKGAQDGAKAEELVRDLNCDVSFNTSTGVTKMVASASVKHTMRELALILDPRSWSCLGDVIAAAYLVERDAQGQYSPTILKDKKGKSLPLGNPWNDQLLFEYAHSEIGSFENILSIEKFEVSNELIRARYELYDCLTCTLGFFSTPGGLTVNQGHVKATPMTGRGNEGWWSIEVLKVVQVQDLTPQDPGNKYDFGEFVNSTIGAALSQWVREAASSLSPVL